MFNCCVLVVVHVAVGWSFWGVSLGQKPDAPAGQATVLATTQTPNAIEAAAMVVSPIAIFFFIFSLSLRFSVVLLGACFEAPKISSMAR